MNQTSDSEAYRQKKAFIQQLLTIYGRKPVLEALEDNKLPCFRLHLAESNKNSSIIKDIIQLAEARGIETQFHDRQALARISKNGKQDQGVCLDIHCKNHQGCQQFLEQEFLEKDKKPTKMLRLLALDRITNPQNLGMIIRSATAGNINGIILPEKGCAKLDSLAIKASAGTVFKAPILRCDDLQSNLVACKKYGATVVGLSGQSQTSIADFSETDFVIYVLGNETEGIEKKIEESCNELVYIPMQNNVESLNVAVAASLLAFKNVI